MLIRNMLTQIGYGRELEKKSPPAVEKDTERKKSHSGEPQDTLEPSAELHHGGGMHSADSVKGLMAALKASYCGKEALSQQAEMAAPREASASGRKADAEVSGRTRPLQREAENPAEWRSSGGVSVPGAIIQAVDHHNQNDKKGFYMIAAGANGSLLMEDSPGILSDEGVANHQELKPVRPQMPNALHTAAEGQNRPLSNEEKKVMEMTEPKESDCEVLNALKRDYRAAYQDAGKELESAQEAAKQGNCVRKDGSCQEVTCLENGSTMVRINAKDGSEKTVQFSPEFPGSVLITKKEPPHTDESGNNVPGKESQVLRRGSTLTVGPGQHGSVMGKGDTVVYRPDAIGNPERIDYLNNDETRNPFAMRYSHVEGRNGRFVKEELCQEKMPEEEKQKTLLKAEKGDEIPHIRRNINQNGDYRDPSGRRLDGTGQKVAVLEADCDDFSGRMGSHAQMVMDTMNSEEIGVAPGAKGVAFEHRSDDNSSLLPGFTSSRRPPETIEIPDNKEALIKELDKAMRFDKRIVPDLERILDAQKKGAELSVLDMSFGEGPNRCMDQVMSLLNVSDPADSGRYARPELRKAILGESANNLPTREALVTDPAGIYQSLNEKKPDGTYANPGLRKALLGDDVGKHTSPEAMEKKVEDLARQVSLKDDNGGFADESLRGKILGPDADKLTQDQQKSKIREHMLHGYRRERLSEEMKKVSAFVNGRMEAPGSGFQQAIGKYRQAISRLAEAGVTVVAAAGNDQQKAPKGSSCIEDGLPSWDSVSPGSSLSYFARSPEVITVAATHSQATSGRYGDDTINDFSSRGEGEGGWNPTVAAPGADLKTNIRGETTEGTSFSAPYVAGIVALMKQADPALTNADIITILKKTAVDITPGISADGAGEVNPEAAVREVLRRAGTLLSL